MLGPSTLNADILPSFSLVTDTDRRLKIRAQDCVCVCIFSLLQNNSFNINGSLNMEYQVIS